MQMSQKAHEIQHTNTNVGRAAKSLFTSLKTDFQDRRSVFRNNDMTKETSYQEDNDASNGPMPTNRASQHRRQTEANEAQTNLHLSPTCKLHSRDTEP